MQSPTTLAPVSVAAATPAANKTWLRTAFASISSMLLGSRTQEESESDAISGWVGTRRRRCRSVGEAR
ncbi:uncharacterized protein N7515_000617 [Penicillium bovifimosum]|uniref:Uncharacterized protein n=1 Tax=Penicillium bovifimosum TaxID=126998 RepID=A0A9W9HG34_9EURO|nr:uncharacterized protein N7515_000617 [Penicillium bovifimosum]KAJ5146053.1 hypothetical protein N7515_000617 [Penicillium bovifimosum]